MKYRVALAQINSVVGDVEKNAAKIIDMIQQAKKAGADLVAFPEQAISGYPAEDLLLKPQFLEANKKALLRIAKKTEGICAIVGFPEAADDVYNAAAVIQDGKVASIYRKIHLPNYGVFDEMRYFMAGIRPQVLNIGDDIRLGLSICEDIWLPGTPETDEVLVGDAQCIINISASPYHVEKAKDRMRMLATRADDLNSYVCFVNMVGGQDELIFDGNSLVLDYEGKILAHAKPFEEDLLICDLDPIAAQRRRLHDPRFRVEKRNAKIENNPIDRIDLKFEKAKGEQKPKDIAPRVEPFTGGAQEVYSALTLGCRDYIRKNGFQKVVLGLSGGVDSAISATVAADALGAENVVTLFMPSRFTSDDSSEDALALAKNLGIQCITVPIEDVFKAYSKVLEPHFKDKKPDTTEENIQARIRGNYLMAFSNKFGYLVLTTGNKSENSVGYATLYGDMAGGFNIIKDVPKVLVYQLCRYRNSLGDSPVIPERILTKAPTAELRADQKDSDSLPEYDELDPILRLYVEQDFSYEQIVQAGFAPETVARVIALVDINEYKRRQASPGIKITPRAFGKDRRLPITNRYRDGKSK